MSTVNPPPAVTESSGLKVTMIVFSAIGLVIWGTSIGFLFGWGYEYYSLQALIGAFISIPVNAGMIYVACRLIFLVTNSTLSSAAGIQDLHQCVARMVAVTILGFSAWISSLVWIVTYGDFDVYVVYHACNYGFVISAVVAGLAGGLLSQVRVRTSTSTGPVHAVTTTAPQPAQVHYNQAYVHQYGQQRA